MLEVLNEAQRVHSNLFDNLISRDTTDEQRALSALRALIFYMSILILIGRKEKSADCSVLGQCYFKMYCVYVFGYAYVEVRGQP